MRKQILFIFLFFSIYLNAQVFEENFDSGIPANWTITNNGVGLGQSWMSSPATVGNNATVAAIIVNETGSVGAPVQDWLISPLINLATLTNPQLEFVGKTMPQGPNVNSVLKIMVSTTDTNLASFQPLATFTESYSGAVNPISPNGNFSLKNLNLVGYGNQSVYIAFVMENTGAGRSWVIDDVQLFNQCLDVSSISIGNVDLTSATVSWNNPGGSNSFELELVSGINAIPTGIATHTTTSNSFTFTNLVFGVTYKVYVRSVCVDNNSNWIASASFTPLTPGITCEAPLIIAALPYTHSDTTANYGDDYNGSPGASCGVTNGYLNGDDVVYSFTASENMIVNIEMIPEATYSGIFVYDDCANIGVNCLAGVASANANVRNINELSLTGGSTYYIVISTWSAPQSVQYTLNIQRVYCTQPINLSATNLTQISAQLGWANGVGNNGTSWEIFVQNTVDNLPTSSGTNVLTTTPVVTQLQNGSALQPSSNYEFYVRSACGDGNFSPWSGPFAFSTLCAPFNLPFSEGFNSTSATEMCWSIINNNNDTRFWDMNYTLNPFEGNQSASINALATGTNTNDDYLITPVFNFNGQYRLRYKYRVNSTTNAQFFSVKMSQNGGTSVTDFSTTIVPDASYTNTTYKEKIVYLPNFVGTGAISWHVQSNLASRIFIDDVVIEEIPVCPEPYDVVSTNTTTSSISIDWQQFGNVDSWDIILLPTGAVFTGDLTGLTVYNTTSKPYTVSNLPSGVMYDVYVKANCSTTSASEWSLSASVGTIVTNDNCIDAISIPVNIGTDCIENVSGSLIGATNSNQGSVCTGVSNNDVWFQFTATATTHILNIANIQGTPTTIYSVIYSGDCEGTLTQIECDTFTTFTASNTINNLISGQVYYVKFYTTTVPASTTFDVCLLTPLQPIAVTTTQYTVPELVTDILINNPCANVTNITWSTGTNIGGVANASGIGYFTKNGSSFGYQDGIILSTGSVLAASGPKGTGTQGATANGWGGDADLSAVLATQGLNGSLNNTTKLEFDFQAITNQMSFNFLFASEEYGTFQCGYSDVFAFLLTDLTTGVTTNIAVVPNTNIPVSVTTIRDNANNNGCPSANVAFFGNYYNGTDAASLGAPINFRGNTISMIAQSVVVPGNNYHIKLAIADYNDSSFDSAVFIEGGSFQMGSIDLGSDLTVDSNNALCAGQTYTLNSGVDPAAYTIEWLKDGVVIPGENSPVLIVDSSGTYTIQATYIGSNCAINDSVIVEIFPSFMDNFNEPKLIKVCSNSDKIVDLTSNESVMLNGMNSNDFVFEYYNSLIDLNANANQIANPEIYIADQSQSIHIKITNVISGCSENVSFEIEYIELSELMIVEDQTVCTSFLLPNLPDGQSYYTGPNATGNLLQQNSYIGGGKHTIYIYNQNDICTDENSFTIDVLACTIQKGISPNSDGLNDFLDLSYYNAMNVKIFNRDGKEVYSHGLGYTNQWMGQDSSGNSLPSGTYFYNIATPFENFTGWIQLTREVK